MTTAWEFALDFYANQGVSGSLLRLQDEHGIDIPLLLVLLYAARSGTHVDYACLQKMVDKASHWNGDVVHPIRQARRNVGPLRQSLYENIKRTELATEQFAINFLADMLPDRTSKARAKDVAAANIAAYCRCIGQDVDLFNEVRTAFEAAPVGEM